MPRVYTAAIPTPEILRPTWGEGPVLGITYTTSPSKAARLLGVGTKDLGTSPDGVDVATHDIGTAEHYPDVVLYRDPTGNHAAWRILDVPANFQPGPVEG